MLEKNEISILEHLRRFKDLITLYLDSITLYDCFKDLFDNIIRSFYLKTCLITLYNRSKDLITL